LPDATVLAGANILFRTSGYAPGLSLLAGVVAEEAADGGQGGLQAAIGSLGLDEAAELGAAALPRSMLRGNEALSRGPRMARTHQFR